MLYLRDFFILLHSVVLANWIKLSIIIIYFGNAVITRRLLWVDVNIGLYSLLIDIVIKRSLSLFELFKLLTTVRVH